MRRLIIVGNWKMNTTPSSAIELAKGIRNLLEGVSDADIAVCPPALCIPAVARELEGSNIAWGAQNAHWEEKGAFTGENSVDAVAETGSSYVILGHSERRHVFGESDEMVSRRLKKVLSSGLLPILCIGETEDEREKGRTEEILARQLDAAIAGLQAPPPLIAYEPVWAIGTGKRAEIKDVEATHRFVRERMLARFGHVKGLRVMYGGSVKPENVSDLAGCEEFDGALVGGASLDADSFTAIVSRALERRKS